MSTGWAKHGEHKEEEEEEERGRARSRPVRKARSSCREEMA
jgi:hypothetical protein